jgi:preprotein translocase subunit Sss1
MPAAFAMAIVGFVGFAAVLLIAFLWLCLFLPNLVH